MLFPPVLALAFPALDPVAIHLGPLAIRWYAIAYVAGVLGGWRYLGWLERKSAAPLLARAQLDDMVFYAVLGVMLGGRIGYALFYNAPYYLEHPAEILQLWHGGMAFHGGLLGVLLAFYLFCRKHGLPYLAVMDRAACATPIGLFFGRLANFVNGELFGRATAMPWGVVFPGGGEQPRHPSQLYEAGLEGLALFLLLFFLARRASALQRPGFLSGVFLIGYGASRFFVEFFRQPDAQLGLIFGPLSMGQLLCLPMLGLGMFLVKNSFSKLPPHVPA